MCVCVPFAGPRALSFIPSDRKVYLSDYFADSGEGEQQRMRVVSTLEKISVDRKALAEKGTFGQR